MGWRRGASSTSSKLWKGLGTQLRACRALSTATATSPASRVLALAISDHLADPAGRSPHAGRAARWRLPSGLPAFRAAVSLYTTSTTGSGGSESHPFLQRRACAASTANAVSCRRPKSRAPGGVRWLGGSSAAMGLLTASVGVVEGRSHPGQRLVVRVRTPRRPRQACWGGGVGGAAAALAGQGVGRCRQD